MKAPIARAIVVGVIAGGALAVTGPSAVLAECPYIPPTPPATDAVRSAREVIVGTVLENVGGQYGDFRLRIDHVLRGAAHIGDVRRVTYLYPGWPIEVGADGTRLEPCTPIPGWTGNVIVLALDALAPDGHTRYNAASWISGEIPSGHEDRVSWTTLVEIEALARLPQTETVAPPSAAVAGGLVGGVMVGSFVLGFVLVALRRRPRRS